MLQQKSIDFWHHINYTNNKPLRNTNPHILPHILVNRFFPGMPFSQKYDLTIARKLEKTNEQIFLKSHSTYT